MTIESIPTIQNNSLVLYKSNPARVLSIGQKIEIEIPGKKTVLVRDKDVILLHSGPVLKLSDLDTLPTGETEDACEMLSGETTTLPLLAELIYGSYTPASAWAVCKLLQDGLYINGTPEKIHVHSKEEYNTIVQNRNAKAQEKDAWTAFIERVRQSKIIDGDKERLSPLVDVALGKSPSSRILKELSLQETPPQAHALLLKLGVWNHMTNPHVQRLGFTLTVNFPELAAFPSENRVDLTHLPAFAIDDEGNKDPDDAIGIEGDKLWIHIADVSSIVAPDTEVDIHARGHATTLYLPEKTVTMLPPAATAMLGLGLQETSPALSFGITLNDDGSIGKTEIVISTVKVTRLTYAQAMNMLNTPPLDAIFRLSQLYRQFRKSQNAIFLSFPEVKIRLNEDIVSITPLPDMDTKDMVSDCMLMAGEAAARFAIDNKIPFPFTAQPSPETIESPQDYAGMFSYRKKLRPSEVKCSPDQHAGLGIKAYTRVTSPLRRYLDLVAHQQIRAFLNGKPLMNEQEIMNRIGSSAAIVGNAQYLERLSNLHWTLVYLLQHPGWEGKGVVIEKRERYAICLIPEIALETRISSQKELSLNEEIRLRVLSVDLPELTAHFSCV
jgi:exoribonuclease II